MVSTIHKEEQKCAGIKQTKPSSGSGDQFGDGQQLGQVPVDPMPVQNGPKPQGQPSQAEPSIAEQDQAGAAGHRQMNGVEPT